ncbi:MAG: secondary thiamine-phosphate synthase enzyme YjbQ [Sphaerochaetaceae bacterium]|jgi:secondary thiamine-phosphate synthase enzyme
MTIYHESIKAQTGVRVTFEDITPRVKNIVKSSKVSNGIVLVYTQHTSCSVFIQEDSEDITYWNETPLILQDMINVLSKIIPTCEYEGQYLHPGPIHMQHAKEWRNEKSEWLLNTDGHLRSVLVGRSVTVPVKEEEVLLGEFGVIYFSDMDQTRERERTIWVTVIGE